MSIGVEVSGTGVVMGVWVWGEWCSAWMNQLLQFGIPPLEAVQVVHDCLPIVHASWERGLRIDLQKDGLRESPDIGIL